MAAIPFTKVVGTGNDFFIVDARRRRFPGVAWRALSRAVCDRRAGIGADGILVLEPSKAADARMRIFNADGSEAQMCGKGARCVARYIRDKRQKTKDRRQETRNGHVTIETGAGQLAASVRGERVALTMTPPTGLRLREILPVDGRRFEAGVLNTGVPHVVVPVASLDRVDVVTLGRRIRQHRRFAPHGTNVNFIQSRGRNRVRIRTYERGVEGETRSCGTGIVASAIIASLRRSSTPGRRRVEVRPRSGDRLAVSFAVARSRRRIQVRDVVLEGAATRVFDGTIQWQGRRR